MRLLYIMTMYSAVHLIENILLIHSYPKLPDCFDIL